MDNPTKYFNINNVAQILSIQQTQFNETLMVIRKKVDKILRKIVCDHRSTSDHCIYVVPESVRNRPPYDRAKMGIALAESLYKSGFSVHGNAWALKISWSLDIIPCRSNNKNMNKLLADLNDMK